ncbi:monovalent cation/H+ antiporter complex subunit F [Sorangium sp. So ce315]|uniref:monovalent cation/H+ antiporter complex subunit F n=1 Tax=Sorangium sp. So ce315 TaxID=3133299 RepID=UPI003F623B7C
MHDVRTGVAVFLLLNVLAGLVRVARGPTLADRILVAQLFGTTGVAVLLLMAADQGMAALRNVALLFAMLAPITAVAFVKHAFGRWTGGGS